MRDSPLEMEVNMIYLDDILGMASIVLIASGFYAFLCLY